MRLWSYCSTHGAIAALLLVSTACGPDVLGGSGTLEGAGAITVKAAYFHPGTFPSDPSGRWSEAPTVDVVMVGAAVSCAHVHDWESKGADGGVVTIHSFGNPIETGTLSLAPQPYLYPTVPFAYVTTSIGRYDQGEVVIERANDDELSGSFAAVSDAADGGVDRFNGTFDAVYCDALVER